MNRRLAILLTLLISSTSGFAQDGALDLDFGEDGFVAWHHSTSGMPVPLQTSVDLAAVATSDTHIFGVGTWGNSHLEWRSFDRTGYAGDAFCSQESNTVFPFGERSRGRAALIDSSGNLLVGGEIAFLGSETHAHPLLARFDVDADGCELDDTFGDNGWATYDDTTFCDTESCTIVALAEILPFTGAVSAPRVIALVRSVIVEDALSRYFLLGVNASGGIQTSFGNQGWREVATGALGALSPEADLAIDGRGRIHVAVTRYDPEGNFDLDAYLLRYSPSGNLVTTVGDGGLVVVDDDGGAEDDEASIVSALAFDANGRAIVGFFKGRSNFAVIDIDGGEAMVRANTVLLAPAVVAQGDGRMIAAHDVSSPQDGFRVQRWLTPEPIDIDADTSFQGDGSSELDVDLGSGDADEVTDIALWHGRPVVVGNADCDALFNPNLVCGYILRLENDYLFADGFESGGRGRWSTGLP